jgi:hypothetical protein
MEVDLDGGWAGVGVLRREGNVVVVADGGERDL